MIMEKISINFKHVPKCFWHGTRATCRHVRTLVFTLLSINCSLIYVFDWGSLVKDAEKLNEEGLDYISVTPEFGNVLVVNESHSL